MFLLFQHNNILDQGKAFLKFPEKKTVWFEFATYE